VILLLLPAVKVCDPPVAAVKVFECGSSREEVRQRKRVAEVE
jgi:hypothetical protein